MDLSEKKKKKKKANKQSKRKKSEREEESKENEANVSSSTESGSSSKKEAEVFKRERRECEVCQTLTADWLRIKPCNHLICDVCVASMAEVDPGRPGNNGRNLRKCVCGEKFSATSGILYQTGKDWDDPKNWHAWPYTFYNEDGVSVGPTHGIMYGKRVSLCDGIKTTTWHIKAPFYSLSCFLSDTEFSVTCSDGTKICIEEKEKKFNLKVDGIVWKEFDEDDKIIMIDQYELRSDH